MQRQRRFVAIGSLGDFDACCLAYYRLVIAADQYNVGAVRLLCAREIYTDAEDFQENCTAFPLEDVLTVTGNVYPFLEVRFNYQPDILSDRVVDELAQRFRLTQISDRQSPAGSTFTIVVLPTPEGVQNHPQFGVIRDEVRRVTEEALVGHAGFRPFGVSLGTDNEVRLAAVDDPSLDEVETVQSICDGFRRGGERGELISAAVVRLRGDATTLELVSHMEHRMGIAIEVIDSVERHASGQIFVSGWPKAVAAAPFHVFADTENDAIEN